MSAGSKRRKISGEDRETIRRIVLRVGRYRGYLVLSLLFAALSAGLALYVPILAGDAIDCIVGAGRVDFRALGSILRKIGAVVAATAACQWLLNLSNNHLAFCTVRDLRRDAFERLQALPLSYLDGHSAGEIVSRVITDADQFSEGLLMGFTQLFTGVMTILGTLLFMLNVDMGITLVVVLITPVSLLLARFIARNTSRLFRIQSETRAEQTTLIDEMIAGQKVVRAYSREKANLEAFDEVNGRLENCSRRALFLSSITNPSTRFVNGLVYAGVGLTGALSVIAGGLTVGGFSCFLSYANQYTKPFNEISGVVAELQNALVCARRVFALIETRAQTPDAPDAKRLDDPRGDVALEHVSFSYDPSKKLITDLNLRAARGQRIAIVGPTGCGKTTLINLLMRFYDVDAGAVLVDGTDVRGITRRSLRQGFGMVLQDTWLMEGTIRANIAFGKPDATEDEILAAARAAHADSFIRRLPEGYDTVINEDGGMLSQGQKQLLCITRVMLRMPPMLILDEATSSIDTRTELRIQKAFARMMEGRTSFVVAHRLSTIRESDVILVMRDGQIVEQGDHRSLMAQNGFYAMLYHSRMTETEA